MGSLHRGSLRPEPIFDTPGIVGKIQKPEGSLSSDRLPDHLFLFFPHRLFDRGSGDPLLPPHPQTNLFVI